MEENITITENQEKTSLTVENSNEQKKKIKKIIIISVSAIVAILIATVIIVICSIHPIHKFALKMFASNSYRMDVVVPDIPFIGDITLAMEIDGNITHTNGNLLISESYTETVNGEKFVYKKKGSNWIKEKQESEGGIVNDILESEALSPEKLKEVFDSQNFEKVKGSKGIYKQKSDVTFKHIKDVVITVSKDSMTVEMILFASGFEIKTEIKFSEVGNVELTLPMTE